MIRWKTEVSNQLLICSNLVSPSFQTVAAGTNGPTAVAHTSMVFAEGTKKLYVLGGGTLQSGSMAPLTQHDFSAAVLIAGGLNALLLIDCEAGDSNCFGTGSRRLSREVSRRAEHLLVLGISLLTLGVPGTRKGIRESVVWLRSHRKRRLALVLYLTRRR